MVRSVFCIKSCGSPAGLDAYAVEEKRSALDHPCPVAVDVARVFDKVQHAINNLIDVRLRQVLLASG
jgi:hypothetical protein